MWGMSCKVSVRFSAKNKQQQQRQKNRDTERQTETICEAIINGIPGHLARRAAQVDNKRLVIEQVLVAALLGGLLGG